MNFNWSGLKRSVFRRRLSRTTTIIVAAVVIVVGSAVVGARWWNDTHPAGIDGAIAVLPASTQNVLFTDWSQVRIQLRVMQGQEVSGLGTWLNSATYSPDSTSADLLSSLTSISLVADPDAALQMQKSLGVSPANLQWEAVGKLPNGSVEVLNPNATVNLASVRSTMLKAGYSPTKTNANILAAPAAISAALPNFSYVVLFPDQHLMVAGANPGVLAGTTQVVAGKARSLNSVTTLTDMTKTLSQPVAADVWVGDYVCGADPISYSAQSYPDATVEQQMSTAISQVGGLTPLVGFALTMNSDNTVTAAAQFTSDAEAQRDLKPRATLAAGPTYVSADNYSQEFSIASAQTKNSTILLNLQPVPGDAVLSQLVQGAIIFASC